MLVFFSFIIIIIISMPCSDCFVLVVFYLFIPAMMFANEKTNISLAKALPGRLELPTLRLTASRSNQLSYGSN